MEQEIYLVGLNHQTAPVEVREKFALSGSPPPPMLPMLKDKLLPFHESGESRMPEALVLSTCNRVELLAVGTGADTPEKMLGCWSSACHRSIEDLRPFVYSYAGLEAVKHIFRVAASLDSMVLGEPQILGQLKEAYRKASDQGSTGVLLNRLLHRAFFVAKRVRSETAVAAAAVSISYAAVKLARRIFGDMSAHTAMLIGAGEMAELAATHLMNAGIQSLWVANRTHERAVALAAQYKGRAVPFDDLFRHLAEVDIVISSTGAQEAIIHAKDIEAVMRKRKNRPIFFIDIAVPRDIDPDVNALDNIFLYDIDDLKEVVEENLTQRQSEAVKAQAIVEDEAAAFMRWQQSLRLQPTIVDLIAHTENIVRLEWERTAHRLDLNAEAQKILQAMLSSIVKKYTHSPLAFLKSSFAENNNSVESIALVRRMFSLDKYRYDKDRYDKE